MQDYNKNAKPVVKAPATQSAFKIQDKDLAPISAAPVAQSAFSKSVMPTNGVTESASAKLQSASKLPGRVNMKDMPSINFE